MDVPLSRFLTWPPFYTLQPNLDTQAQQMALWSQVLLDFAKDKRLFIATSESFNKITRNTELNRSLSQEFQENLFNYMKKQKLIVSEGLSYLVFWQKPESWAESIYQWAVDSGRIGTVETVEGLVSGDDTVGQSFYGMPVNFAFCVLKTLEKTRKAEMFKVGEGFAVKFF